MNVNVNVKRVVAKKAVDEVHKDGFNVVQKPDDFDIDKVNDVNGRQVWATGRCRFRYRRRRPEGPPGRRAHPRGQPVHA